jgi:parvulin-like peptidyl-prolyl isomerase
VISSPAADPGEISEIQDLSDGYYLMQVAESRPSRIPELSTIEGTVKQDLVKEMQKDLARKDVAALLEDVKSGSGLEQAAGKLGVAVHTTDYIKRSDPIADLGSEPGINQAAFELSERQPLPTEPIQTAKGFCVIRFADRKEPAMENFEKERGQIKDRLLQQKKFKIWEAWMSALRAGSQIERKKDLI